MWAHINKTHTHTHTHTQHQDMVATVNTTGHLGLVSGLYGLRAITATSYWLWQILCHSLGNPSKLVIYLFGTLLTLSLTASPCCLSPLSHTLSSLHPPSVLQFSLVSHLLFNLSFHFTVSQFLSPHVSLCFSLSPPPFFFHASYSLSNITFVYPSSFPFSHLSLFAVILFLHSVFAIFCHFF